MTGTLSYFPKLSGEAKRQDANAEESGLVLNGAKVIFDKEAPLMPVTLQPKKKSTDGRKGN
jgi:hypothetical protein